MTKWRKDICTTCGKQGVLLRGSSMWYRCHNCRGPDWDNATALIELQAMAIVHKAISEID